MQMSLNRHFSEASCNLVAGRLVRQVALVAQMKRPDRHLLLFMGEQTADLHGVWSFGWRSLLPCEDL